MRHRALVLLALAWQAEGCASGPRASTWVTTADRTRLLAAQPPVAPMHGPVPTGTLVVDVDTAARYQRMAGFGAAITDASAAVLQRHLTPTARDALLQELFGPSGAGLSVTRLTIGGSDFSQAPYTLDDTPGDVDDPGLRHFALAPETRAVLAIARQARGINPRLLVMATPWSPPAWMKAPRRLAGGTLRPDVGADFAWYLVRALRAFDSAGVPVHLLSLQNEPHHEPPDYPGMRLAPAQRAALVRDHVGPALARAGLRPQLLEWDHNWDAPVSPLAVLADSGARRYLAGVAWHCYAGDVAAQSAVHDAFPALDTWFTECSGGDWAPDFGDNLLWNVRTLLIGATRHWARGVLWWNLALDDAHGPHTGGCGNCRGVVTIDRATGRVTRNEEYYALAHAGRFVRPGATRLGTEPSRGEVESVAFRNEDGSHVVILANAAGARTVLVRQGARAWPIALPARSVATVTWR